MGVKFVDAGLLAVDVLVADVVGRMVTVVEVVGADKLREKLMTIASLGSEVVDVDLLVAELLIMDFSVTGPVVG